MSFNLSELQNALQNVPLRTSKRRSSQEEKSSKRLANEADRLRAEISLLENELSRMKDEYVEARIFLEKYKREIKDIPEGTRKHDWYLETIEETTDYLVNREDELEDLDTQIASLEGKLYRVENPPGFAKRQ